jgi:hypothetical protein
MPQQDTHPQTQPQPGQNPERNHKDDNRGRSQTSEVNQGNAQVNNVEPNPPQSIPE